MGFLSRFISSARTGERNFERGRAAEQRGDFSAAQGYFLKGAEAYDVHLADQMRAGRTVRPSHHVKAGICYVRIGRDRDALRVLDLALAQRTIPDAYLHAGYAAAQLGDREKAREYWSRYPDWAGQIHISRELKAQTAALGHGADLDDSCTAVARAMLAQDKANAKARPTLRLSRPVPPHRGY